MITDLDRDMATLVHGDKEDVSKFILSRVGKGHEIFAFQLTEAMFRREGKPIVDRMKIENAQLATELRAYRRIAELFMGRVSLLNKLLGDADLASFYAMRKEIADALAEAKEIAEGYIEAADHRNHKSPEFPPEWNV